VSGDTVVGPGGGAWDELRRIPGIGELSIPWPVERAERLGLHASLRRFYRLTPGDTASSVAASAGAVADGGADAVQVGEVPSSAVLVVYEQDDADAVERYARTARWFAAAGVRVPAVLSSSSRGLLVEDGGDSLLSEESAGVGLAPLYREAASVISRIQVHGHGARAPNPGWALNAERLRNELDFTEEHALRGWLKQAPSPRRALAFDRLAEAVAALPTAICHRDYHSRNLLVSGSGLFVVDFQDAMAGPIFYDLASLLRDDYRDLTTGCRAAALETFWEGTVSRPDQPAAAIELCPTAAVPGDPGLLPPPARQAWTLTIAQRTLKALGTFGFQVSRAGRHEYANYAQRTWGHARRALADLGWDELIDDLAAFDRL